MNQYLLYDGFIAAKLHLLSLKCKKLKHFRLVKVLIWVVRKSYPKLPYGLIVQSYKVYAT